MAEMAAALAAMDFGADHEMAGVLGGLDRARQRVEKARPAGAAVEFLGRAEQFLAAADAKEGAAAFFVVQCAGARAVRCRGRATRHIAPA